MPRYWFYLFALLTIPLIVGCEGCTPATTKDPVSDEDKEAPKEAYSTELVITYPADQSATTGSVKPGHWTTAEQSIRSNKADTRGELTSRASVDLRDVNLEKTGSISTMDTARPVVLPKGQMRGFDYRFRCPIPNSIDTRNLFLSSRLIPRSGGILDTGNVRFNVMRASEYFFIVLTNRPDQFTRLQVADWAQSNESRLDGPVSSANYRIVVPNADNMLSLPESMLDLTSTAVVLWDDLSEDALTPMQQSALSDWIRFGGRLIVNGPAASDAVANTMLADLLPLIPTSNIELDGDAAVELLRSHSVKSDRTLENQIQNIRSENSRIAIDGQLDPRAVAIDGTSSLVLSRQVGRGHVIQPRFDLTDNWIEAWDSYDSFVNSVVLNRPSRRYMKPSYADEGESDAALQSDQGFDPRDMTLVFDGTKIRSDAAVNTQFRLASRDSLLGGSDQDVKANSPFDPYSRVDSITGIASWSDSSDTINLLKQTLTSEAGIEIPGSSLVVRSLAIYLLVLVPLNYLVFRLMNRLEYAWFAVPVIAVVGAIWAARQARLDIGFARSNTELAVLEVHGDYPRAHLTRMIGVYNSLSSRYELQFPTVDGAASPLQNESDPGTDVQPLLRVSYEEGPSLADFAVPSNRMRYVHTEEMVDLGGGFTLDPSGQLVSASTVDLLDAILVQKSDSGDTQIAVVGSLDAGESTELNLISTERLMVAAELPMQTNRLIRRFASPNLIPNGATRLIGRIEGTLDGVTISPSASQHIAQTIAIVHLRHPEMEKPTPDTNLVSDFRRVNRIETTQQAPSPSDSDEATTTDTADQEKE